MPDPKLAALKDQAAKRNPSVPQASGSVSLVTPPKGYKLNSPAPTSYSPEDFKGLPDNSDVPNFIRQGIDMNKVRQVPADFPSEDTGKNVVAYVSPDAPYDVNVVQPDIYGPPIKNHELTHTFQQTRNPALGDISAPLDRHGKVATANAYDYGGVEGLKKAQQARKTITSFNDEQQAEIVKDYKGIQNKYLAKAKTEMLTDADKKAMYAAHQAYHPFVSQLAGMPGQDVKLNPSLLDMALGRLPKIDVNPAAPGLPDYSVKGLGVVPADPLLGGKSAYPEMIKHEIPRKMGDTKRFSNGKTGKWDGHGWVAQ